MLAALAALVLPVTLGVVRPAALVDVPGRRAAASGSGSRPTTQVAGLISQDGSEGAAARQLDEARKLLQAGQTEAALSVLQRLQGRSPDSPDVLLYLGAAYLQMNQPAAAEPVLRRAIASGAAPVARYYLGVALLRQERWSEALVQLEVVRQRTPDHAAAHYEAAYGYYRLGEHAEAATALDEALRLQPDWSAAWERRGIVAIGLDDRDAALHAWQRAVETAATADRRRLQRRLADLYLILDRPREALALFERLGERDADLELRMKIVEAALAVGEVERATAVLDPIVEALPDWGPGLYYRAAAARRSARPVEARSWFERAVARLPAGTLAPVPGPPIYGAERQPLALRARVQLAELLRSSGEKDDLLRARALLEEVVAAGTYYVEAHYLLGRVLTALGDPAARPVLERFARMRRAAAAVEIAAGSLETEPPRAERAVRRALAADPECPLAHYLLGEMQRRGRDRSAARQSFGRALALDPWLTEAYRALAELLTELGEADEAAKLLEEAARRGLIPPEEGVDGQRGGVR